MKCNTKGRCRLHQNFVYRCAPESLATLLYIRVSAKELLLHHSTPAFSAFHPVFGCGNHAATSASKHNLQSTALLLAMRTSQGRFVLSGILSPGIGLLGAWQDSNLHRAAYALVLFLLYYKHQVFMKTTIAGGGWEQQSPKNLCSSKQITSTMKKLLYELEHYLFEVHPPYISLTYPTPCRSS